MLDSLRDWWEGRGGGVSEEDARLRTFGERESIFDFVQRHTDPDTGRLTAHGGTLPDEPPFDAQRLRFVPGALDGVGVHHMPPGSQEKQVRDLHRAFRRAAQHRSVAALRSLARLLRDADVLAVVDPLLAALAAERDLSTERLLALAKWLARSAPERNAVKVAMALLGLVTDDDAVQLLETLGRHEEFTLYAAAALASTVDEPDARLWALARAVDGWGRIHTIERLRDTRDPRIRRWLLCEGYRNFVMLEYTALVCAQAGGLVEVLRGQPDDTELRGAGAILAALIDGAEGPAEGIDDYADANEAIGLFVQHVAGRPPLLENLLAVGTLRAYLGVDTTDRSARGLAADRREELLRLCGRILADAAWEPLVDRGLQAEASDEFALASRAAEVLGRDTWEVHLARLAAGREPRSHCWYEVCRTEDRARMARVIQLAEEILPLDSIATGPGNALGFGPDFEHHSELDWVLQALRRFPGLGWSLLRTGLASPVVRNRTMASVALGAWGEGRWGPEVRPVLTAALAKEPDEGVRPLLSEVLRGAVLDRR